VNPERHAQVKTILLQALEQPVGAPRQRFVERACGDDGALRVEVEALLREETGQRDSFLEIPAVLFLGGAAEAFSQAVSGPTPLPEQFGPFRLLDKLGQGGMGTVYRAEQLEPVRRQVALKVISTSLTHRQSRLRFGAECQALARLSHPNIASMYEAGTTHMGQPFVAMELVEGVPIHRYADLRTLGPSQRLQLFLGVCAGVQHAHQKGILHRDLKPTNILVTEVDGEPIPKVIDFGIAKAVDQPLVAETFLTAGQVIGSPAYMSPEAATLDAERDLDTRADVYSLGCLLHELLLGVRRFGDQNSGIGPLLRRIAEEEPARLSSRWQSLSPVKQHALAAQRGLEVGALARRLRGDLDAIVLKAMARDRERRYGSVEELAADVRRHLAHQPIHARPPSLPYLWSRFLRRHARAAVVVGFLLLISVVGIFALTRETQRARRAEEQTRQALVEAEQVSAFLVDLFEGSDPETAPGESTTLREILDRAAERLPTELRDQPLVQARLLQTIGSVYLSLGRLEPAQQQVEKALALRRAHLPPGHPETVESLNQMGVIHRRAGRYQEAEPLLRQVLDWRQHTEPPDPLLLSLAHANLGNVLWNQGRYGEAEASYQRALEIQRAAFGDDHREVGATLLNLGTLYWTQGRVEEARPLFERSIEILEAALGPDNPRVTAGRNNLALVLGAQGETARAEALHRQVLATWERVLGPDHPDVAGSLSNLGRLAADGGRFDEAQRLYDRALEIRRKALGEEHPRTLQVQSSIAALLWRQGHSEESEALHRQVLASRERVLGPDHPSVAATLSNLAEIDQTRGRLQAAEAALRRALKIRQAASGLENSMAIRTQRQLADTLVKLNQHQEAAALYREILPLSETLQGAEHEETVKIRQALKNLKL
jgi:eukaryotic-like serine/threonine-protein kinase